MSAKRTATRKWAKRALIVLVVSYPVTIAGAFYDLLWRRQLPREMGAKRLIRFGKRFLNPS